MRRNKFSLSHYKLATMEMGKLVPIAWYEALPGDTIQQATSCLVRTSPLLAPVMHPVQVRIHHWFVPNRLIWEHWPEFITGGKDGLNATEPPTIAKVTIDEGSIHDYLGVPPADYSGVPNGAIPFSALPMRAYNLIYNENYRDQDLSDEAVVSRADGLDEETTQLIQFVSWEKDYFTTARPWTQKGTEVTIPLGQNAPVVPDGDGRPWFDIGGTQAPLGKQGGTDNVHWVGGNDSNTGNAQWETTALQADLANATGINVNDLREALAIQRYQEARAKYGSRYSEYLAYLGVRPRDARLQEPEYLGGGRQTIQFSEVLRTGEDVNGPIGDMKGHGITALRSNRYRRFIEEHGIVMTLMSVVPKSIYTSNMQRGFMRHNKEDYFQKELQFIGEQAVFNGELQTDHAQPDDVFGYQQRYDEYRHMNSTVAGEFRSTLNHWHLGREFAGNVALNHGFIGCNPTRRVFASTDTHPIYVMANHSIQARRMISKHPIARVI